EGEFFLSFLSEKIFYPIPCNIQIPQLHLQVEFKYIYILPHPQTPSLWEWGLVAYAPFGGVSSISRTHVIFK
ncbi:MAG: hypothetical protein SNI57_04440, partial [Rikenellaceae bacterium]